MPINCGYRCARDSLLAFHLKRSPTENKRTTACTGQFDRIFLLPKLSSCSNESGSTARGPIRVFFCSVRLERPEKSKVQDGYLPAYRVAKEIYKFSEK